MQHAIKLRLQQPRIALKNMEQQLRALGPEQTLNRGYAIISDQNGAIVRDADALKSGDQLNAKLAKGAATLIVSK